MKTPIPVAAARLRAIIAAAENCPDAAPPQVAKLPYASGRLVALRTDLSALTGISPAHVGQIIRDRSTSCYPPRWVDVTDFLRSLGEVRQYTRENITLPDLAAGGESSDESAGGIEL